MPVVQPLVVWAGAAVWVVQSQSLRLQRGENLEDGRSSTGTAHLAEMMPPSKLSQNYADVYTELEQASADVC